MSTIKDMEKLNNRGLETLKRKHSRQIEQMEGAHQNYKSEIKKAQNEEILELQDEGQRRISIESDKKEKILSQMRAQVQQTQDLTDKQLKSIKDNTKTLAAQEKTKLAEERERTIADHELYMADIHHRLSTQTKKVNQEGQGQVEKIKFDASREISDKEAFYQDKLNKQTNDFNLRFKEDGSTYERMKTDQDLQFKKQRLKTNENQQIQMAKITKTHDQFLEEKDENFRKELKSQDSLFQKKYADSMKIQNDDYKKLEERHNKILSKMKDGLREEIESAANRSEDPFYKFTTLRPKLKESAEQVIVEVEVPEYAKQDVLLTINNKEAIVNFNRRYDDQNKTEDGTINKLHKVESFTTRLQATRPLDPKSVKTEYSDGLMTFTIKKA